MTIDVVDALGRHVRLARPAERIASLVPSETETVCALIGDTSRLIARTDYCEEPAAQIGEVASVGGTKNVDVEAVVRLAPDLVLANQEENTKRDVERLIAAGLTVHVSFVRSVEEAFAYVDALGRLLGIAGGSGSGSGSGSRSGSGSGPGSGSVSGSGSESASASGLRAFVPIWNDPLMTFDGRTYASDLLASIGVRNVFADRPRRYPLAADLGRREPLSDARLGDRDTRYPRVTLEEVAARRPDVVLLPNEPYRFTAADVPRFAGFAPRVLLVSGKDLFWYGARTRSGAERLAYSLGTELEW